MHPREPGLTHLPAPQLERVGAKCHSSEVGATTPALARDTDPGALLLFSMGEPPPPTEQPAWGHHQLFVTPDAPVCLTGRKEMTSEGRTPHRHPVGE